MGIRGYPPVGLGLDGGGRHAPFLVLCGLGGVVGVRQPRGRGVQQNDTEAVAWYRKAAEQGDALAQHNLGVRYYLGHGVPQDYARAYMWINLAAAQGLDVAIKLRDNTIAKALTPSQIEEGQRLAAVGLGLDGAACSPTIAGKATVL